MATYNFKKEVKVYVVIGTDKYELTVGPDISFSQTFTDKTYPQKTLHAQHKVHEASNITKANPANFQVTLPVLKEPDLDPVYRLLTDYKTGEYTLNTFDLYIESTTDTYKLEKCVITNGTFIIEKLENLKLTLSGQASKLSIFAGSIPGAAVFVSVPRTRQTIDYLSVSIDSVLQSEALYKVSVELQNDIKWTAYETVNDALNVTTSATSMYPSSFTLEKRILSGSIGQYITSVSKTNVQTWKTGIPIVIKAGTSLTQGVQFDLVNCSFTNRATVEDVFTQSYDWKMNDNPTDLSSKITF
jgi:hypothetical protein|tara:strand:+ start:1645 stop:2544 length:900 start_codon:yes stop_codon:yes gene_type:complete